MSEQPTPTTDETLAEALAALARMLSCSQCGRAFDQRSCGIAHAIIQADPRQHNAIKLVIDRAVVSAVTGVQMLAERALRKGYDLDPQDVLDAIGDDR